MDMICFFNLAAHSAMTNMHTRLKTCVRDVRNGWNMAHYAQRLAQKLEGGKRPQEDTIQNFERYAAQAVMNARAQLREGSSDWLF